MPTVTIDPSKPDRKFDIYVKTKSCERYNETLQTFIIEDIFPTEDFADAIMGATERMRRMGFGECLFFEIRKVTAGRSEIFRKTQDKPHDPSYLPYISSI